jgi:tetratricopeptide (TPR) repeat protein
MNRSATRTWAERHLAGWPVGLALVLSALLSAALVVPRPVPPAQLPLPVIDRREQRQRAADEQALFESASREPLPYEVRAIGETLRRFGLASRNQPEHARTLKGQLKELVARARDEHGDRALLALRALQTHLFTQALRARGSATAEASEREALELGGELSSPVEHPSWYAEHGFVGSDGELAVLFRMRWNALLELSKAQPFAPTLNEWRLYFRFLLRRSALNEAVPGRPAADALSYLAALGELDPDYPIDFARGVVLYRRGAYDQAARAFMAHLQLHPDGPWTLRAQNHLAACGAALSRGDATGDTWLALERSP